METNDAMWALLERKELELNMEMTDDDREAALEALLVTVELYANATDRQGNVTELGFMLLEEYSFLW